MTSLDWMNSYTPKIGVFNANTNFLKGTQLFEFENFYIFKLSIKFCFVLISKIVTVFSRCGRNEVIKVVLVPITPFQSNY